MKDDNNIKNNKQLEEFVENTDLSNYDFSEFQPTSFEFQPKDTSITLRISKQLLQAVKKQADKQGIPYQRFMRMILEQSASA